MWGLRVRSVGLNFLPEVIDVVLVEDLVFKKVLFGLIISMAMAMGGDGVSSFRQGFEKVMIGMLVILLLEVFFDV